MKRNSPLTSLVALATIAALLTLPSPNETKKLLAEAEAKLGVMEELFDLGVSIYALTGQNEVLSSLIDLTVGIAKTQDEIDALTWICDTDAIYFAANGYPRSGYESQTDYEPVNTDSDLDGDGEIEALLDAIFGPIDASKVTFNPTNPFLSQ